MPVSERARAGASISAARARQSAASSASRGGSTPRVCRARSHSQICSTFARVGTRFERVARRSWRARRWIGEDVTEVQDARDVLRVCSHYELRRVAAAPFPAWLVDETV